jgi:hypothetical protein
MQPPGDHQVKHEPVIAIESDCDALSNPPQLANTAPLQEGSRRLLRSQDERIDHADSFERQTDDALFEGGYVGGDVGQLGHAKCFVPAAAFPPLCRGVIE